MSLLQIYQWVCKWKNCENRLTFGEVMGKSLVSCFFWDTVYIWFSSTNRRNRKSPRGFESKYCLIYNVCCITYPRSWQWGTQPAPVHPLRLRLRHNRRRQTSPPVPGPVPPPGESLWVYATASNLIIHAVTMRVAKYWLWVDFSPRDVGLRYA